MSRLAWIDLETTGLDPHKGKLLEVAFIATEADLSVVEGSAGSWIIGYDEAELNKDIFPLCDDYVTNMHLESGLFEALLQHAAGRVIVRQSMVEEKLRRRLHDFGCTNCLSPFTEGEYKSPLCGSSVHFDRAWLGVHMPDILRLLSYRNIDVSSVQELVDRWYRPPKESKKGTHRALTDLQASIQQLQTLKGRYFLTSMWGHERANGG